MYISKISLKNWKNFKDVSAALRERAFLIGSNASGKSNLLDAFRFLRDIANNGLEKSVNEIRGGLSALRCLAATRYSSIDLEVELSNGTKGTWRYRVAINQDNLRRPVIREEAVFKNEEKIIERPNEDDKYDDFLLTQTALEQVSENRHFRELVDAFKSITYQHLLPQVVRDPYGFSQRPMKNDPYGRDFLIRLWKTSKKSRDSRLKKINSALAIAVPQLSDLQIEMDDSGIPHLVGSYTHWRPHAAKQNESQFSDGTLRLLGLLWTVYEGSGPLLLEEPEISLHPEIVRRLPDIFYRINRGRKERRQIIIATHSEEMLAEESIAPEEVFILKPSDSGTKICAPDEADRQAIANGLTAADVLMPKAAPKDLEQLTLRLEDGN